MGLWSDITGYFDGSASLSTGGGSSPSIGTPLSNYPNTASPIDWPQTLSPINLLTGQGFIREGSTAPIAQAISDAPGKVMDTAKNIVSGIEWGTMFLLIFAGFIIYTVAKQTKITKLA